MINTNTYTWIGIEIFIKIVEMFTPLHPPAKLYYVPIAQHDVGQSGWGPNVECFQAF